MEALSKNKRTKFCRRCRTEIPRTSKFCKICGAQQVQVEHSTAEEKKEPQVHPSRLSASTPRFGRRTQLGLVMILVAIMLVWFSMSGVWYTEKFSGTYSQISGINGTDDYLNQYCDQIPTGSFAYPGQNCNPYGQECLPWPPYSCVGIAVPFSNANTLMFNGLILAILTFIFLVLGTLWPTILTIKINMLAMAVCGILGSALVLIAPLYLSAALRSSGFQWSGLENTGWLTALIACICFVTATITSFQGLKKVVPLGNISFDPKGILCIVLYIVIVLPLLLLLLFQLFLLIFY